MKIPVINQEFETWYIENYKPISKFIRSSSMDFYMNSTIDFSFQSFKAGYKLKEKETK